MHLQGLKGLRLREPAVFGVNLKFVRPFIMSMVGGGVGGFLASLLHLRATGMSITGISEKQSADTREPDHRVISKGDTAQSMTAVYHTLLLTISPLNIRCGGMVTTGYRHFLLYRRMEPRIRS